MTNKKLKENIDEPFPYVINNMDELRDRFTDIIKKNEGQVIDTLSDYDARFCTESEFLKLIKGKQILKSGDWRLDDPEVAERVSASLEFYVMPGPELISRYTGAGYVVKELDGFYTTKGKVTPVKDNTTDDEYFDFIIPCNKCGARVNITSDSDGFMAKTEDKSNSHSMSCTGVNTTVSVFGDCPYCKMQIEITIDKEKSTIVC